MPIDNPQVAALAEPRRLLSSLGGPLLSLDQDLLVIPIKLELASQAVVEGEGTNAGPFCAFEDLGDTGDDITVRLHCPKTAENGVRAFLVPSQDDWNLRLDGSNLESGYIDFLIDDAATDGTLEGFIVLRKTVLNYTPGSYSSGGTVPAARGRYLPEQTLYPVQSSVEDLALWAASFLVDDEEAVTGCRAPSAIAVTVDAGDVMVESVDFQPPNVIFGGLAAGTGSVASTASPYRVIRGTAADYAIVDGDGVLVDDIDTVVYTTTPQHIVMLALQSMHGLQPDWANAHELTGQDIPVRTTGEVGYPLWSSWRRACLIPLSVTLDVNSVITAAVLCPGVRVHSEDVGTAARLSIDFGAVGAQGFFALAVHRASGDSYAIYEANLAAGTINFAVDVSANLGVFDIFILAHLDSER